MHYDHDASLTSRLFQDFYPPLYTASNINVITTEIEIFYNSRKLLIDPEQKVK
jgi:hypothetical protein